MTDLIDEVQEDLKTERYNVIVHRITKLFAVAAVIVIIGVSAYVWKERSVLQLHDQLGVWLNQGFVAVDNNQLDEAIVYFDKIIDHSHQQYAAIAYFQKAALLFKQNKIAEGQEVLLSIANQQHFDRAIRELAQINYLGSQLNSEKADLNQAEEILSKLTHENKPWRLLGLQLKALYEIKYNKIPEAKASLNEILTSRSATRASYDNASSILASIAQTEK